MGRKCKRKTCKICGNPLHGERQICQACRLEIMGRKDRCQKGRICIICGKPLKQNQKRTCGSACYETWHDIQSAENYKANKKEQAKHTPKTGIEQPRSKRKKLDQLTEDIIRSRELDMDYGLYIQYKKRLQEGQR